VMKRASSRSSVSTDSKGGEVSSGSVGGGVDGGWFVTTGMAENAGEITGKKPCNWTTILSMCFPLWAPFSGVENGVQSEVLGPA
jgi:hypothetical protein